jgi:hypothetical protein
MKGTIGSADRNLFVIFVAFVQMDWVSILFRGGSETAPYAGAAFFD